MELFKRIEMGRELSWEEIDTNWTRIKNAIDHTEQAIEDTRTNKEWILPLYLLGDAEAEERAWLGLIDFAGNEAAGIHYRNGDVLTAIAAAEQYRGIVHQSESAILSVVSVGAGAGGFDFGITIQDYSPYSEAGISMSSSSIALFNDSAIGLLVGKYDAQLHIGFFGEHASQQTIAEASTDPAITELQDILIIYGLALDNRNP